MTHRRTPSLNLLHQSKVDFEANEPLLEQNESSYQDFSENDESQTNRKHFIFPAALFIASVLLILLILETTYERPKTRYVFSFGDSYTLDLFNIDGPWPNRENPFGNPPFPGVTTANGPNWIGTLIQYLSPTPTLSYNLAIGGSCVDGELILGAASIFNLINSTDQFVQRMSPSKTLPWNADNSAFLFWYGTNDVMRTWRDEEHTLPLADLYAQILTKFFESMDKLYDTGARRFLFLTKDNLARTPRFIYNIDEYGIGLVTNAVKEWNAQLNSHAAQWMHEKQDVKASVLDVMPIFDEVLDNAQRYGAPDNMWAEQRDGSPALWRDELHPGVVIHRQLAHAAFAALTKLGFYE